MKLYFTSTSPYVRKVRILLAEINKTDEVELHFCHPFESHDELRKVNPLGKIPALSTNSGEVLFESEIICDYLLDHFSLTQVNKILSNKLLAELANGIIDTAITIVFETRRPEQFQYDEFINMQLARIDNVLSHLSNNLPQEEFNVLDRYQLNLAVALGYLDFRLGELFEWREKYPSISKWFKAVESRSSFIDSSPKV